MSHPTLVEFTMNLKVSSQLLEGILAFRDKDGKQLGAFVATSGLPGYQSPAHFKTKRKGLCPPGKNYLVKTDGYPLSTIGVEGMFYHILPDPVPVYGRGELGIHRDANVPGSSGCIVVRDSNSFNTKVIPLFKAARAAGITALPLHVIYDAPKKEVTVPETVAGGKLTFNEDEADILARTIYGEARGEVREGRIAVGRVVMNRVKQGGWWGDDVREVCLKPYQFSCWNKNDPNYKIISSISTENKDFADCLGIAQGILSGMLKDNTLGANHYHTKSVRPSWSKGKLPVATIGNHLFFKL